MSNSTSKRTFDEHQVCNFETVDNPCSPLKIKKKIFFPKNFSFFTKIMF